MTRQLRRAAAREAAKSERKGSIPRTTFAASAGYDVFGHQVFAVVPMAHAEALFQHLCDNLPHLEFELSFSLDALSGGNTAARITGHHDPKLHVGDDEVFDVCEHILTRAHQLGLRHEDVQLPYLMARSPAPGRSASASDRGSTAPS